MTHVREVAKKLVLVFHGVICLTDKLTTTVLESMGTTLLALITIPFACINRLGFLSNYIFHLIFDTLFTLFAFGLLPVLRAVWGFVAAGYGFCFPGRDTHEQPEQLDSKPKLKI